MPGEVTYPYRPGSPFKIEETNPVKRDKNFRRYASAVDRALSLFDTALQEWADYIAFLGRLLKALQTKPADAHEIPHSKLLAKRLSQCLNPSLPPGVHQKALEVYGFVFSILGKNGLSAELPLYLPGLSPLLSFASLVVRPLLLSLFETHFVNLDVLALRPALRALIMALLPGLEESAGEDFERAHNLLNKFRSVLANESSENRHLGVTDDRAFWQSFFLTCTSTGGKRQGALVYLERNLPKLVVDLPVSTDVEPGKMVTSVEIPGFIEAITSPEPGLLIRAFAAGLSDEQLLVQRGFLELMVTHLPLDSVIFRTKVNVQDLELLISAATSVVLRREMSLNRRLWLWFLGQAASLEQDDPASPQSHNSPEHRSSGKTSPVSFFETYALEPLISGLVKNFSSQSLNPVSRAKPFKICLSLMDRWEIGGLVVPRVFRVAMESLFRYGRSADSREAFQEVLRSANVFFDAIQSHLIWKEITILITEAAYDGSNDNTQGPSSGSRPLDLVWFIVTRFNIREEEMLVLHLPNALTMLIDCAQTVLSVKDGSADHIDWDTFETLVKVATYLFDQIPERALNEDLSTKNPSNDLAPGTRQSERSGQMSGIIGEWYLGAGQRSNDQSTPIHPSALKSFVSDSSLRLTTCLLKNPDSIGHFSPVVSLARKVIVKISVQAQQGSTELLSTLSTITNELASDSESESSFHRTLDLISGIELASELIDPQCWRADPSVRQIVGDLQRLLWPHVSSRSPRNSVEATRCLWRLHYISPETQMLEAAVSSFLYKSGKEPPGHHITFEGLQRFTSLWTYTVAASQSNRRSSLTPKDLTVSSSSERAPYAPETLVMPLLLVLDTLKQIDSELALFTSSWLQTIQSVPLILDILVGRLSTATLLYQDPPTRESGAKHTTYAEPEVMTYLIRTITAILNLDSEHINLGFSVRSEHSGFNLQKPHLEDHTQPRDADSSGRENRPPIKEQLLDFGLDALRTARSGTTEQHDLARCCAEMLQQLMKNIEFDPEPFRRAISTFTDSLHWSVEQADTRLQISLLNLMRLVITKAPPSLESRQFQAIQTTEKQTHGSDKQHESKKEDTSVGISSATIVNTKKTLLDSMMLALASQESQSALPYWVPFLDFVLPYYAPTLFQILLPLFDAIKVSIELSFKQLRNALDQASSASVFTGEPIQSINALYNALEIVLARSHDQVTQQETKKTRLPEPSQGYFGNMVGGIFASETQAPKPATANDRLTVLLCFRDAVRISFNIWAWEDPGRKHPNHETVTASSFNYLSVRLKNRTRRALEHLFAAEPLECMEAMTEVWKAGGVSTGDVTTLFTTLEATRPKHTMPAIFNAIYSRTNSASLDPFKTSTLTADLSEVQLAAFLVSYTRSMDDDALDEVWTDCVTFTKDILANPMPQRQILPLLIEFIAVLGDMINNTNYGEHRRMAKEIGDLFVRLIAAMFTIKPITFQQQDSSLAHRGTTTKEDYGDIRSSESPIGVIAIVSSVLPKMVKILTDADRISTAASTISTQILGPAFHWKGFPSNITADILSIMRTMSRVTETSKLWRRDITEAFNEPKFFSTKPLSLVKRGWIPLLHQLTILDKDRISELLSRLAAPTSAGIMFGVGASSARLEADRKTQVTLRRIALIVLAADDDAFVLNIRLMQDKIVELLSATATSSPSSNTRAEVYMVFRALALKNSSFHLTSLWPIINSELNEVLASMVQIASREIYSITSILQAAKLLDSLLVLGLDDFQLCEWLYITDTVEAVYRPPGWRPVALIDEMVDILDNQNHTSNGATPFTAGLSAEGRKPLLRWDDIHQLPREKWLDQVLTPFMRHLSINAFESTYRMEKPDKEACFDELLKDLFDDSTLV